MYLDKFTLFINVPASVSQAAFTYNDSLLKVECLSADQRMKQLYWLYIANPTCMQDTSNQWKSLKPFIKITLDNDGISCINILVQNARHTGARLFFHKRDFMQFVTELARHLYLSYLVVKLDLPFSSTAVHFVYRVIYILYMKF